MCSLGLVRVLGTEGPTKFAGNLRSSIVGAIVNNIIDRIIHGTKLRHGTIAESDPQLPRLTQVSRLEAKAEAQNWWPKRAVSCNRKSVGNKRPVLLLRATASRSGTKCTKHEFGRHDEPIPPQTQHPGSTRKSGHSKHLKKRNAS